MTVTANTTRNDYTAGSAQSEYDYTFQLNEAADVDVYLDGVKQTLNTHYVVQNVGNASGGTIVFTLEDENGDPIHPTQGAVINIVMAMDLDRDTNYQPSGAFLAADVNNDFDRLWLATNQQQTAVNRALRLKDTDVTTSSMELPLKDDRKGKLLAFNATTGDPEATTNNQSNWDTAYNNMITSASFTGGNYTLTQQDGGTISTSLDGRYLQLTGGTLTGTLSTSNIAVESGSSLTFANAAFAISSNGTESIIRETGSGDLSIEGENLYLRSTPTANYLSGTAGAEVKLYHNNSEKLSTTTTGISVTGNLDFGDNEEARFGDSADLKIYHNGTSSIIQDAGTGDLALLGTNLAFANGAGTSYYASGTDGGAFTLYYNGSEKLATTSGGISVTGTITATGYNDSNWNAAYNDKINSASFDTSNGVLTLTQQDGGTVTVDLDGRYSTDTGIALGDNQKATFGDSNDLEIYHDGSNSYIKDSGTGYLILGNSDAGTIIKNGSGQNLLTTTASEIRLGHEGNTKLATKSTGIDVTGTVTADGLIVDGTDSLRSSADDSLINISGGNATNSGANYALFGETHASLAGVHRWRTDGNERMRIDSSGNVGIGTTNPQKLLEVASNSSPTIRISNTRNDANWTADPVFGALEFYSFDGSGSGQSVRASVKAEASSQFGNATELIFRNGDALGVQQENMRINYLGNVGIGTTSPNQLLSLNSTASTARGISIDQSGAERVKLLYTNSSGAFDINNTTAGYTSFSNNGSERMRIDSSGNVLVGKTASSLNTTGIQLQNDGLLRATRSGADVLQLNRQSSDGAITTFYKDGSTVGSIGTKNGYLQAGTADTQLAYVNSDKTIRPFLENGSNSDGNISLGVSGARFKDLHLSGTGYFGTIHTVGANTNATNLATSATNAKVKFQNNSASSLSSYQGYTGNSWYTQVANGNGTTAYDLSLNPYGGNVGIGTTSPNDKFHVANGSTGAGYLRIANNEGYARLGTDGGNLLLDVGGSEKVRIDSSGNVGIGTTSPNYELTVAGGGNNSIQIVSSTTGTGATNGLRFWNTGSSTAMWNYDNTPTLFGTNNTERLRIDSSGRVGIGTTSPAANLHVDASAPEFRLSQSGTAKVRLRTTGDNYINTGQNLGIGTTSPSTALDVNGTVTATAFAGDGSNLTGVLSDLVDDTTPQLGGALDANDKEIQNVNQIGIGFSGNVDYNIHVEDTKPLTNVEMVRIKNTSNTFGRVMTFYKSSNHHGSIGLSSVNFGQGVFVSSQQGGLKFQNQFSTVVVEPCGGDGADYDNAVDLGRSSNRFDDIYATNSTIQTSDRNLKQDIESLTDAEQRVAVAAKGLLRKFRWISAVEEKGDDARIHFGIIAQDLRDAFTAEGLDVGRYAMFTSTTWWEHEGENYYEADHAPEGATEVTRLGVRYSELLAFIISAI